MLQGTSIHASLYEALTHSCYKAQAFTLLFMEQNTFMLQGTSIHASLYGAKHTHVTRNKHSRFSVWSTNTLMLQGTSIHASLYGALTHSFYKAQALTLLFMEH